MIPRSSSSLLTEVFFPTIKILSVDDPQITTPLTTVQLLLVGRGLSLLTAETLRRGAAGNPNQIATATPNLRYDARGIAFVCVFVPWRTHSQVGLFDERFVGYGFDDYCARVLADGLKIAILGWLRCRPRTTALYVQKIFRASRPPRTVAMLP